MNKLKHATYFLAIMSLVVGACSCTSKEIFTDVPEMKEQLKTISDSLEIKPISKMDVWVKSQNASVSFKYRTDDPLRFINKVIGLAKDGDFVVVGHTETGSRNFQNYYFCHSKIKHRSLVIEESEKKVVGIYISTDRSHPIFGKADCS